MVIEKGITRVKSHTTMVLQYFYCSSKIIKIVSVSLMLLFALLFSFSTTYFRLIPYRQQETNEILKHHRVCTYARDCPFLRVDKREQEAYIEWVRKKRIPYELKQQFGSNYITNGLVFLEKNSFIISALENILFYYNKADKLNATVGLGIPALLSLIMLIIRRKIFIKIWFKNALILSFFVVLFSCCSHPYLSGSNNYDNIGFHGNIVLVIGVPIFLILIGALGFEAGVIYVLCFLSLLLIDIFFHMSAVQFNIMFPYTFNGIGGAGFNDGLFLLPLWGFIVVSLGWLIRRAVLWGKRKYLMISKRRKDRRLASNDQQ